MDFLPLEERVTFKHQETEKLVKVQLLEVEKAEVNETTPVIRGDDDGSVENDDKEKETSLVF